MDNLFKYLFLLILTTMVFSCQNRPSEVLPRKKMENVMYDMYIAEAIIESDYQDFVQPENKEALIDQVLKKHKISEARWDTSLSWYSDKIDLYLQINDSVKSRLERRQKDLDREVTLLASQAAQYQVKGPDYIPLHFRIATLGCKRGFKFKLDSTQLVERFGEEDSLFFRFKLLGIHPSDSYSLKSMLTVNYSDTTVYQYSDLYENKAYSFPLYRTIDKDTISSVDGFVLLSGKFPQVPIQLYQISLSGDVNDNDSIVAIEASSADSIGAEVSRKDSISTVVDNKDRIDSNSNKLKLQVVKDTLRQELKMTTE